MWAGAIAGSWPFPWRVPFLYCAVSIAVISCAPAPWMPPLVHGNALVVACERHQTLGIAPRALLWPSSLSCGDLPALPSSATHASDCCSSNSTIHIPWQGAFDHLPSSPRPQAQQI